MPRSWIGFNIVRWETIGIKESCRWLLILLCLLCILFVIAISFVGSTPPMIVVDNFEWSLICMYLGFLFYAFGL